MLPGARDYHPLATEAFKAPVPAALTRYLERNTGRLLPQLASVWKMYDLLRQLSPVLARQRGKRRIDGVLFDKQNRETILAIGGYRFTCRHDYIRWTGRRTRPATHGRRQAR